MLTTDDKKFIQKTMIDSQAELLEKVFLPYLDQMHKENQEEHKEIVEKIVTMDKDIQELKEETGEIKEYIKDHEKRIRRLEVVTGV